MRYGLDIKSLGFDSGDPEMLLEWPERFHDLALERSRLGRPRFTTTF
jgi:hypothetical protein